MVFHANKIISSHGRIALHEYLKNEYMSDDDLAHIKVKINDDIALFDPLSVGNQTELNMEIIDFIDRKSELIDPVIPVVLDFYSNGISEQDEQLLKDCIKEYYSSRMFYERNEYRCNRKKCILLAIFGMLMLSAYFALDYMLGDGLRTEIISIIGSFALWESADLFLLERRELIGRMKRVARLMNAKVNIVAIKY